MTFIEAILCTMSGLALGLTIGTILERKALAKHLNTSLPNHFRDVARKTLANAALRMRESGQRALIPGARYLEIVVEEFAREWEEKEP